MDEQTLAIERVEQAAFADLHAAASPQLHRTLGLRLERVGTAQVSIAVREPSILLNRAIGLGIEAADVRETVFEVVSRYRRAAVARFFFHLHPQAEPPGLRDWMSEAGLEPGRGWMKFKRGTAPPPEVGSELEVREIGAEHAADFGRIAVAAFGMSERAAPLAVALLGRPGWRLYMSFADGRPAGTGALFVKDQVGWCDWGATDPAFRGRGGQSAVLARRVRDALAMGCRLLGTETGEAVESDPQHSYNNILKIGFEETVVRENFLPRDPG
jgi:GNAT superfamily N-acetyltransferase